MTCLKAAIFGCQKWLSILLFSREYVKIQLEEYHSNVETLSNRR